MWQSWENTKTYELKDCTVDELIQFIENKYTINPNCRFFLRFNIKNHERTILNFYGGKVFSVEVIRLLALSTVWPCRSISIE